MEQWNWAGNYQYRAARLHFPETTEQIQEITARSRKVKALGTRHSFNGIADTTEDLLCLTQYRRILALDPVRRTVTVEAGIPYGSLCQYLYREGFALHNMASLPHISAAGACATATHGSGDKNGVLATAVTALEIVTADGSLRAFSREQDGALFSGAVVGLGGLGIVTRLTLTIVPAFTVRQDVYENLPLTELAAHFDAIMSSAYSVSLFTDWQGPRFTQVWQKRIVTEGEDFVPEPDFFAATRAAHSLHPIAGISAENCTAQLGIPGPAPDRLPHFRMDYMPSSGEELQTEYLVPRQNAVAALNALTALQDAIVPLLLISEVRTVAADDLWMSPCYRQDSVALHFTWKKRPDCGGASPAANRSTARVFRGPTALGQSVYHAPRTPPNALPETAGIPAIGRELRSGRQISQCVFGRRYF